MLYSVLSIETDPNFMKANNLLIINYSVEYLKKSCKTANYFLSHPFFPSTTMTYKPDNFRQKNLLK